MELVRGDVVRSIAGHDKGSLMLVCEISGDDVFVVDGRLRKLEKPKKKNRKHLRFTARPANEPDVPESNSSVRKILAQYSE